MVRKQINKKFIAVLLVVMFFSSCITPLLASETGDVMENLAAPDEFEEQVENFGDPQSIQPLTAPLNLEGEAGDKNIELTWEAAGEATGIDHYLVQWNNEPFESAEQEGIGQQQIEADKTSCSLADLTNGQEYWLRVKAVSSEVELSSSFSEAIKLVPIAAEPKDEPEIEARLGEALVAPTNLVGKAGAGTIELTWEVAEDTTGIDHYLVQWDDKPFVSAEQTVLGEQQVTGNTSCLLTGLTNRQEYWLRVKAVNSDAALSSSFSEPIQVVPIEITLRNAAGEEGLPTPRIVTGEAGDEKIELTWEVAGDATEIANYRVQWDDAPFVSAEQTVLGQALVSNSTTNYTLENLNNEKAYWVRVQALGSDPSLFSSFSQPFLAVPKETFDTDDTPGYLYNLAGNGNYYQDGVVTSDVPAAETEISGIAGLSVNSVGIYQVDNDLTTAQVRMIATVDGTFFGIPMKKGKIYTIAGNGNGNDLSGYVDGGIAKTMPLSLRDISPVSDAEGNLYLVHSKTVCKLNIKDGTIHRVVGINPYVKKGDTVPPVKVEDATPATEVNFMGNNLTAFTRDQEGNLYLVGNYAAGKTKLYVVPAQDGFDRFSLTGTLAQHLYEIPSVNIDITNISLSEIKIDEKDNIYVASSGKHVIYMVPSAQGSYYGQFMKADQLYRIAGNSGQKGFGGDGGLATEPGVQLTSPRGITVDSIGNLYFSDDRQYIRMIDENGILHTISGGGTLGSGEEGPAWNAYSGKTVTGTYRLAYDEETKRLYLQGDYRIRYIYQPTDSSNWAISLPVGITNKFPDEGIVYEPHLDLNKYITVHDKNGNDCGEDFKELVQWSVSSEMGILKGSILQLGKMEGTVTVTPKLTFRSVNIDQPISFTLLKGVPALKRIAIKSENPKLVYPGKTIQYDLTQLALEGSDQFEAGFDLDDLTKTWEVVHGSEIAKIYGNTLSITGEGYVAVAVTVDGVRSNVLSVTRKEDTIISKIAGRDNSFHGDGIPAIDALPASGSYFNIKIDDAGNILLVDPSAYAIRLIPARDYDSLYGLSNLKANYIYTVAGKFMEKDNNSPPEGSIAHMIGFANPSGLAIAPLGGFYFTDGYDSGGVNKHNRLYHVDNDGKVWYIAGNGKAGVRLGLDDNPLNKQIETLNGNEGPALNASLLTAYGISVDRIGNIYVMENRTNSLRVIPVKDYKGEDKLYGMSNLQKGYIYVIAGNGKYNENKAPETQGSNIRQTEVKSYGQPPAFDSQGNMYIPDGSNKRLIKVFPNGSFINLVGDGKRAAVDTDIDGKPANKAAGLHSIGSVALDGADNIYFDEFTIGKPYSFYMIPSADGVYHGKAMKKGYIYRIAGGKMDQGEWQEGGLAKDATFPSGSSRPIVTNKAGELLILHNGVIRLQTPSFLAKLELTASQNDISVKVGKSDAINLGARKLGDSQLQLKGYDLSGKEFDLTGVDVQWKVAGGPGQIATNGKSLSIKENGTVKLQAVAYGQDGIGSNTIQVAASLIGGTKSSSGGGKLPVTEQEKLATLIEEAIKAGKAPVITIGEKEKSVTIGGEQLLANQEQGNLIIFANQGQELALSAELVEQLNLSKDAKVEVYFTLAQQKLDSETLARLKQFNALNETLASQGKQIEIKVNGQSVGRRNQPIGVTVDVSNLNLTNEQKASLTGVIYDSSGNIKQQLGGEFSADGKSFTYYTYQPGEHSIIISDNLKRMQWQIGSRGYVLNGQNNLNDVAPVILEGRTLLPLKAIGDSLEAEVKWDGATKTVSVTKDGKTASLTIGKPLPEGLGTSIIINSRTFVPIRYFAEQLGANVVWEAQSKRVYIYQ